MLYLHAVTWGIASAVCPTNAYVHLLSALLMASVATYAAIEDSKIRRVSFVHILQILYFMTWPFASLVYLLVTRGWRGLGWWIVHVVGFYATVLLALFLTHLILASLGLVGALG